MCHSILVITQTCSNGHPVMLEKKRRCCNGQAMEHFEKRNWPLIDRSRGTMCGVFQNSRARNCLVMPDDKVSMVEASTCGICAAVRLRINQLQVAPRVKHRLVSNTRQRIALEKERLNELESAAAQGQDVEAELSKQRDIMQALDQKEAEYKQQFEEATANLESAEDDTVKSCVADMYPIVDSRFQGLVHWRNAGHTEEALEYVSAPEAQYFPPPGHPAREA